MILTEYEWDVTSSVSSVSSQGPWAMTFLVSISALSIHETLFLTFPSRCVLMCVKRQVQGEGSALETMQGSLQSL